MNCLIIDYKEHYLYNSIVDAFIDTIIKLAWIDENTEPTIEQKHEAIDKLKLTYYTIFIVKDGKIEQCYHEDCKKLLKENIKNYTFI